MFEHFSQFKGMQELALITSAYISLYSWVSNRRQGQNKWGGCNKWGGWQKSPKLINREVGINGEAGKNTAIRNLTEIKSSNDLVKISTKRT